MSYFSKLREERNPKKLVVFYNKNLNETQMWELWNSNLLKEILKMKKKKMKAQVSIFKYHTIWKKNELSMITIGRNSENVNNQQQAAFTKEEKNDENILYACHKAPKEQKNVWYLDSDCNNHMMGDMEFTFCSKMKLDNGEYVEIEGKGNIGVETKQGSVWYKLTEFKFRN